MSLLLLFAGATQGEAVVLVAGASATMNVPPDDPTLEVYRVWDAATLRVLGDDPTFTIED